MMWWIVVAAIAIYSIAQQRQSTRTSTIQLPSPDESALPRTVRCCSWVLYVGSLLFLSWTFLHFLIGSGPLEPYLKPATMTPMPTPASSRLLFFIIDRSGSMAEPMPGDQKLSKIDVVKTGLLECINTIDTHGGESDLLGLITFARVAKIDVPLSRDRAFLRQVITAIAPETIERLNGTAIGYAIFKTVALIEACRSFASGEKGPSDVGNTVILITDGLEEPNPADRSDPFRSMRTLQALSTAAENHIKIHYINVDKNSYQQLMPDERDHLRQAVEATGGRYYEITQNQALGDVLSTIALAEGVKGAPPLSGSSLEIGFWLFVFATFVTSLSRLLETAVVRVSR
jgi:Ca-activated chloride channel family protein